MKARKLPGPKLYHEVLSQFKLGLLAPAVNHPTDYMPSHLVIYHNSSDFYFSLIRIFFYIRDKFKKVFNTILHRILFPNVEYLFGWWFFSWWNKTIMEQNILDLASSVCTRWLKFIIVRIYIIGIYKTLKLLNTIWRYCQSRCVNFHIVLSPYQGAALLFAFSIFRNVDRWSQLWFGTGIDWTGLDRAISRPRIFARFEFNESNGSTR